MTDVINKIKIKKPDGTMSDYIPIGAEAKNVIDEDSLSISYKINKKPYYFNSVADMKNAKLKNGDCCITLGYYNINDGGGATYNIRTKTKSDVEDNGLIIGINATLVAELIIINNTIDFRQIGAKKNDKTSDCKIQLDKYIAICNYKDITYKLIIPEGVWYFSPTLLYRTEGVNIEGCKKFRSTDKKCTQISPITEEQDYIWKIGGYADIHQTTGDQITATRSVVIDGLVFSGNNIGGKWSSLETALFVDCCMYCTFNNLYFQNIWGTGLTIRQSWEIYWGMLNFRGIANFEKPAIHIAPTTNPYHGVAENVSANYFNYLMFEGIDGDYIYSEGVSGFEHNEINDIQIELSVCNNQRGTTITEITDEIDKSSFINNFIFKGFAKYLVINMINIFTARNFYATNNGNNYILSGVIGNDILNTSDYYGVQDIAINLLKISSRANKFNSLSAIYNRDAMTNSMITISTLHWWGVEPLKPFDCEGGNGIRIGQYNHYSGNVTPSNIVCLANFPTNTSVLYYDIDSLNDKKLVLKGNINRNEIALARLSTYLSNKKIKFRLKGKEGVSYKFRLQGYVKGSIVNKYFDYTGTGNFDYYICENLEFDDGYLQVIGAIKDNTSLIFDTIEFINIE